MSVDNFSGTVESGDIEVISTEEKEKGGNRRYNRVYNYMTNIMEGEHIFRRGPFREKVLTFCIHLYGLYD
jgi:hypothetical protein